MSTTLALFVITLVIVAAVDHFTNASRALFRLDPWFVRVNLSLMAAAPTVTMRQWAGTPRALLFGAACAVGCLDVLWAGYLGRQAAQAAKRGVNPGAKGGNMRGAGKGGGPQTNDQAQIAPGDRDHAGGRANRRGLSQRTGKSDHIGGHYP